MDTDQMENNSWIPFQEVDFNDKSILQYYIDTRDFHCKTNKEELTTLGDKINWDKISKYPDRFYYTDGEVSFFLQRIFQESGGEGEWRYLVLDIPKGENWNFKYIRIYRIIDNTFLICNKDSYAMNKEILTAPVVTEYLNFMKEPLKEPSEQVVSTVKNDNGNLLIE